MGHRLSPQIAALVVALVLTASANAAFGFAAVLTNDVERAKITMVDVPGQRDVLVVAWQDVPGVTPATGAMAYYRDRGSSELRYYAIGGGGRFSIIERGSSRRFRGTVALVFEVVSDDPKHPLVFIADTSQTVDAAAVLAQYAAFENIAAPGDTRAAIESAVAARATQANRACGSKLAPKLAWKTFATPASLRLAKQAVSILESVEAICSDKDYAEAVRGLRELQVDYQADGGALRLEKTSTALVVRFSDTSFNPRETARLWLRDHL